jgi:ATP-dependent Clp protease adaptor protein ClpS
MATANLEICPEESLPATPVRPEAAPDERTQAKRQPPYAVVLHNDDVNGFDYVIGVLQKVFHYGFTKAFWLTLKAHISGRSIVWSGSMEVAEFKADQVRSCGPDPRPRSSQRGACSLRVSVEPLPGNGDS